MATNFTNDLNFIKLVVFDYGRTLYDRDNNTFFADTKNVLEYLHKKYTLAIVSIAKEDSPEQRIKALQHARLHDYFSSILFDGSQKDALFKEILDKFNLSAKEIVIIDDRIQRGIKWGNKNGAITVWFRNGKFADELPDAETGHPNYTIESLKVLKDIL